MLRKLLLTSLILFLGSGVLAQKHEVIADVTLLSNATVADVRYGDEELATSAAGYGDYCTARSSYYEALKVYDDVPKRTAAFEAAIQAINKATEQEADNPSYWLMKAQIYRSRGGVGLAKNYFAKACAGYEKILQNDSEVISNNLQYAIACYAGDAQFYPDYNNYKAKAGKCAKTALRAIDEIECAPENKQAIEIVGAELAEQKFLAYIILHDEKKLARLKVQIKDKYVATPLAEMLADYEDLVLNGKWYWKVSDKDAAEKAFLLYYLRNWGN